MSCQAYVLSATADSQRKLVVRYNNQSPLVIFLVKDNLVNLCRSNSVVDKFSWICYPLDDVDIFFSRHHTATLRIVFGRMELARNFLDISSTASDDCSDGIHIRVVAANGYLGPIASFPRYAHDFHSSVIDFWDFLLHQALDHFWMAATDKDIDTARVIFYLVDKDFDAVMRGKDLTRNLVLLR